MSSEKTVFAEASALTSPQERSAYLDRACAGNAELRRSVEELLAAHDRSQGVLESPTAALGLAGVAVTPAPPTEHVTARTRPPRCWRVRSRSTSCAASLLAAWGRAVRDRAHERAKGLTAIRAGGRFFLLVFLGFSQIRDFVVRD